jgi:hypothetical protein
MQKNIPGFNIVLYDETASTLANESGDVMYAMEYSSDNIKDHEKKKDDFSSSTKIYSDAVENTCNLKCNGKIQSTHTYPLTWKKGKVLTQQGTIVGQ